MLIEILEKITVKKIIWEIRSYRKRSLIIFRDKRQLAHFKYLPNSYLWDGIDGKRMKEHENSKEWQSNLLSISLWEWARQILTSIFVYVVFISTINKTIIFFLETKLKDITILGSNGISAINSRRTLTVSKFRSLIAWSWKNTVHKYSNVTFNQIISYKTSLANMRT